MPRLLIADNSPFYRRLLKEALEEAGHEVHTVCDGSEALEVLTEESFEAIVLDLVMPKLSGARACRQIKRNPATQSIPVIILSGLREDEIDEADEIGADAFVAKMQAAEMIQHLENVIDELLGGRLEMSRRGFEAMHRREVVSELLEGRRSREALLGSLSEGFLRISEADRVIEANPAALLMLGMDESQLVNRPVAEILGCEPGRLRSLFAGGDRAVVRLPAGAHVLDVRGLGGGRDDDRYLLLSDVTGEVRPEPRQGDPGGPVHHNQEASSLGEIVAAFAHELKNPLTAILGYAELLLQFCPDERSRGRLEKLDREAHRCRRLVDNLLCFARKRQTYRRSHNLNGVVAKVLDAQAGSAEQAGIEVRRQLEPDLPPAAIDYGQIEQVMQNLLTNAFQALAARPEGERVVTVRTRAEGGRLVLEVEDNGPGIPVGSRQHIFEPFFTTRRPEGGSGLGLAVSYGIIEEHGGRIQALDAAPGALLRVELPVAARPVAAQQGTAPAILVVDQEPVVIDLLEDILSDAGFRVERAGNGAQALERITEVDFDAVLIDVKMADLDSRHLFEAIRERRPDLASRVAFTTDDPGSPAVIQLIRDTAATLLPKPFRVEEVAETCLALTGR